MSKKITILGGGAWGTALGCMAAQNGHEVVLYARDPATVDDINHNHRNGRYLGNIALHDSLRATSDATAALNNADTVLAVIPAQSMAAALQELKPLIPADCPVVLCAKGIERSTGRLMSQIIADILPDHPIAALSGPSFASDVARGFPTAVTIACENIAIADDLATQFSGSTFRCYSSDDLTGVEIGGALKNVIAVAAGATIGKGLGASAQAALVTRAFAELRRIAVAFGGRPETLMGLSGLGDLMLSCSSPQSRNYSYGLALGRGEPLEGLLLAEGVATAPVIAELCARKQINAPIITTIAALLNGSITIDAAVTGLLSRPLKNED
ncbi:NAD(P)-dependent glycerol-3-phosphate dehydrogenase [Pseudochrobactrum algeriensis]|uniref:NAD(P)H-dependent glycerol-3-phosphate dehydrogenase n=1 Tax=Pseudochrobactrum algeriensis TaxID=2834768 RepID=UPI001BCF8417|nr:NAD(P)H-dependent glycerol-3-phosphate dehydrogenase [Pseudochrobactrum algeriensis]QVQ36706.1 NAD(P)-dependent glycerol-3-phosphate dehydrogenase [Pseudochrobactrum algeriensis]QVQ39921.1 NAD(P)-dependent glycerol-3-phosphate dehydrogenase [Pseudochrobactrum algeriensis]QVQ43844.1 NAD(P)-dependent glycerol-3-phosphate dehydrogenase [Pseudochrobactrum algeriensis]